MKGISQSRKNQTRRNHVLLIRHDNSPCSAGESAFIIPFSVSERTRCLLMWKYSRNRTWHDRGSLLVCIILLRYDNFCLNVVASGSDCMTMAQPVARQ